MNRGNGRILLGGCLTLLIGCGARTSTLESEFGGQSAGGDSGNAGSHAGFGGVSPGGSGGALTAGFAGSHPIPIAGSPAGGFGTGGGQTAGAPAGGFGTGGLQTAGGPAGGAPAAGAPSGGASGFAGFGGDAGTGGIAELCTVLGGSSCAECQCQTCAPAIESCFSDLGCTFIFACAQQKGCTGISCYSPSKCQPVIDQFGGPLGTSVQKVFSLLTCAVSAQANCGCH